MKRNVCLMTAKCLFCKLLEDCLSSLELHSKRSGVTFLLPIVFTLSCSHTKEPVIFIQKTCYSFFKSFYFVVFLLPSSQPVSKKIRYLLFPMRPFKTELYSL